MMVEFWNTIIIILWYIYMHTWYTLHVGTCMYMYVRVVIIDYREQLRNCSLIFITNFYYEHSSNSMAILPPI